MKKKSKPKFSLATCNCEQVLLVKYDNFTSGDFWLLADIENEIVHLTAQKSGKSPTTEISATAPRSVTQAATVDHAATNVVLEKQIFENDKKQIAATENARKDAMIIAGYTETAHNQEVAFVFASQTAQKRASTATKAAQGTDTALRDANATTVSVLATENSYRPTQIILVARAQDEAKYGWLWYFWVSIIVLAAVALIFAASYSLWTRANLVPAEQDETLEPESPRVALVDRRTSNAVIPTPPPGDPVAFLKWAEIGLQNVSLSHDHMVGALKPYNSHLQYRDVMTWATKWGLIQRDENGTPTLSPDGRVYCQRAVDSPSPAGNIAQEPPLPANERYSNDYYPGGGGGLPVADGENGETK